MLTRDSWLWTLGIIAALLSYLAASPAAPWDWTWPEWVQALSVLVGILSAALRSSALAGASTPFRDTYPAFFGLLRMKEKP